MGWIVKKCLFLIFLISALPLQAALLKGRVTDEQGQALPFATLFIRNTTTGTATNEQGFYQMQLPAGSYEIVFQYVGYKAKVEQIDLKEATVERNVTLQLDIYSLREIEVKASDKDPAYAIVKAAIARRKYHLNEVLAYQCRVYTKGLTRLLQVPNRVLGIKINDLKPGIAYLSESVSQLSFRQPDKLHERMISSKVSGSQKGFSFNRASRVNFNFYENLIRAPGMTERAFISPISANALLTYRYKLIGATQVNGQFVNKIKVTPIRRNDPAFEGFIYIIEDSWRLHSLDLKLFKSQIEYADTVRIRQSFGPVQHGIWMMLSQKLTTEFETFGFKGNGYFTSVYSDYKIQPAYPVPPLPDPVTGNPAPAATEPIATARLASKKREFRKQQKVNADALFDKKKIKGEIMVVEKDANKRDTAYWEEMRPIPLTLEEQKDYGQKDSIQVIVESKPYQDSVDQKNNKFELANLFLAGYQYRNSFKRYSLSFSPVIDLLRNTSILEYNTVEGAVINLNLQYRKWYDESSRELVVTPAVRYGFGNERLQAKIYSRYRYNPKKYSTVSGSLGWFVFQFDQSDPISSFRNTTYTLFWEHNYMKLYQKGFAHINHRSEITNGFFVDVGLEYADRSQLFNTASYTVRDWSNNQFTSNTPENVETTDTSFPRNQSMQATLELQFRPGQQYINRPDEKWILRSKYPTFRVNYTKGIKDVLGSDVNYDRVAFTISDLLDLGLLGRSNYRVQTGTFLNKKQLWFMDYKHFSGNRTLYAGGFGGFQLLDYYQYSTTNQYLEAHFTHEFNGFIFNKIPLFRKMKWQEVVSLNYLRTPTSKNYLEAGIGIEHIFKILRVDFITSFQSNSKVDSGIRFGFGF